MAKLGEGDARWIVNERKDGTNCNAWHWEEKDLSAATETALKAAFKDLTLVENDKMSLKVKEASEVKGEVTVAQRKGKIMCYFEIKVTLKYSGSVSDNDGSCDGKIEMPEVDHDCFKDDFEVRVSTSENNSAATQALQWVQKEGRPAVRKVVAKYFNDLFEAHNVGKNLKQLQQGGGASPSGSPAGAPAPAAQKPVEQAKPKPAATSSPSSSASPSKINWKIQWKCPAEDLWTVLTDQGRASAYTRAPAKIDPRNGGTFEFLGGTISGYYVEIEHPKKITMQWRLSSWKSGVFSTVVMILDQEERGVTNLEFAQQGIPEGELERVKQGWTVNFWDPIKMMFGFPMEWK